MKRNRFKDAFPETPESFHRMVEETVKMKKEESKIKVLHDERSRKSASPRRRAVIAAAVFACILLIPGMVYAAVRLSHRADVQPEGSYGANVAFEVEGTDAADAETTVAEANTVEAIAFEAAESIDTAAADEPEASYVLPDPIPLYRRVVDYVPEGMSWSTRDQYHIYDDEDPDHRAFAFFGIVFDGGSIQDALLIKNVVERQILTIGEREAVYIRLADKLNGNPWNQRIYLLFPEQHYMLETIFTDGISVEEAAQVVGSVHLEETGETVKREQAWTWTDMIADNTGREEVYTVEAYAIGDDSNIQVASIGGTEETIGMNRDAMGTIRVRLDDVQISDDLSLLDPEFVEQEIWDAADEDGALLPAEVSFVLKGDGVDTIDTVVASRMVRQKLVYVALTYTNVSEENLDGTLFFDALCFLTHEDGKFLNYVQPCSGDEPYSYIVRSNGFSLETMHYYDVRGTAGDGGNHFDEFGPGDSVTIHVAYVVDEDLLPYMYLCVDGTNNLASALANQGKVTIFDIRQ